jgi:hypothetical protein
MLTVRPAVENDVTSLAPRLRAADVQEVEAHGYTPEQALHEGFWFTKAFTAVDRHGTPVCMFGVAPMHDPSVGAVWLLGTDLVKENRMSFLRLSLKWTMEFHKTFTVLGNIVDERNTVHIEWLRWLGYSFHRRIPDYGPQRRPFLEFARLHHVPTSGTTSDGRGLARD